MASEQGGPFNQMPDQGFPHESSRKKSLPVQDEYRISTGCAWHCLSLPGIAWHCSAPARHLVHEGSKLATANEANRAILDMKIRDIAGMKEEQDGTETTK
jgi:hypothetical protein